MAQGGKLRINPKKRSGGASKKKTQTSKQSKKGWKACTTKKQHKVASARTETGVSKSINAKNEAIVAGKALANRSTIFLGDLKSAGKDELKRLNKEKKRVTEKHTKKSYVERAKVQLQKLNGGI